MEYILTLIKSSLVFLIMVVILLNNCYTPAENNAELVGTENSQEIDLSTGAKSESVIAKPHSKHSSKDDSPLEIEFKWNPKPDFGLATKLKQGTSTIPLKNPITPKYKLKNNVEDIQLWVFGPDKNGDLSEHHCAYERFTYEQIKRIAGSPIIIDINNCAD